MGACSNVGENDGVEGVSQRVIREVDFLKDKVRRTSNRCACHIVANDATVAIESDDPTLPVKAAYGIRDWSDAPKPTQLA
jgi:hypothetical protein